ncbi:MAG: pilus assembly protein [Bacilli bacterium]|nr:pilus assembly protein [Bacilli bacterium]
MINKKGQALVEFVLVLPIIILLIFVVFDIGHIILTKNHLESVMSDCVEMNSNGKTIDEIRSYLNSDKEYKITLDVIGGEHTTYRLETKIKLMTPGMKRILSNPYKVTLERRIVNE